MLRTYLDVPKGDSLTVFIKWYPMLDITWNSGHWQSGYGIQYYLPLFVTGVQWFCGSHTITACSIDASAFLHRVREKTILLNVPAHMDSDAAL